MSTSMTEKINLGIRRSIPVSAMWKLVCRSVAWLLGLIQLSKEDRIRAGIYLDGGGRE
jgi:hypothetical protein